MDSSIKTLTITGAAAVTGSADPKKPRRGISRRKRFEDDETPETQIEDPRQFQIEKANHSAQVPAPRPHVTVARPHVQAQHVIHRPQVLGQAKPQPLAQPLTQPLAQPQAHAQPQPPRQLQLEEVKPISSVILNPPKVQRVKLQPKVAAPKQVAGTRKARRISLSLTNLNHRFTRAKKVRDETDKKSIDAIRTYLIEKGVIQTKSRAPEKMLRSMFNDFNMLKDEQAM